MELSNQQTFKCSNDRLTISFASYDNAITVEDSKGNRIIIDVTPEQMTASFLKSVGYLSINYHESKQIYVNRQLSYKMIVTILRQLCKKTEDLTFDLIVDKERCTTNKQRFVSGNQQIL